MSNVIADGNLKEENVYIFILYFWNLDISYLVVIAREVAISLML